VVDWKDELPWRENPDDALFEEEWAEFVGGPYDGTIEQRFVPRGSPPHVIGVSFAQPEDFENLDEPRLTARQPDGFYVPVERTMAYGKVRREWVPGSEFPPSNTGNVTRPPIRLPPES
jgi:hypothetical protein